MRHLLAIRHLADERKNVNDHAGLGELSVELARRVVVREHVMVVVVALADRPERHEEVLDRASRTRTSVSWEKITILALAGFRRDDNTA